MPVKLAQHRSQSDESSGPAPVDPLVDQLDDSLLAKARVDGPTRGSDGSDTEDPAPKKKKGVFRKGFHAVGRALGRGGDERRKRVRSQANSIPNKDIVYEQLAHAGAYGRLDNTKLAAWGYTEANVIDDTASGFRAVLYLPSAGASADTDEGRLARSIHGGLPAPVLALRGTANKKGVQDDVNKRGVGSYQFRANQAVIAQLLGKAGGNAVVTGHSLGGALAQLTAVHLSGVGRVVTFQAPGISAEDTKKLADRNADAAPEDRVHSTHYRADGDIVHRAGESHTEGDVTMLHSKGINGPNAHKYFPLSRVNAARGSLIPGVSGKGGSVAKDNLTRVTHSTTDKSDRSLARGLHEGGRTALGGMVRDDTQDTYSTLWDNVQKMVGSGQYTQSRIEAVIDAAPGLTTNQRIRMRVQTDLLMQ